MILIPVSSFRAKREIFVIRGSGTHVFPTCAAHLSTFFNCLSYRQCPIRPFGAPSPRGEGCDTRETCHRRPPGIAPYIFAALLYFYAPHHHFAFLISNFSFKRGFQTQSKGTPPHGLTLIKSLSDFTLEVLCIARNNLTRIASYLRKAMTKLCIKILVKSDSAIESAFP